MAFRGTAAALSDLIADVIKGGQVIGAEIVGGIVRGAEFVGGTFTGGSFTGGSFTGTTFTGGTFDGGTFTGAQLVGALIRTALSGQRLEIGNADNLSTVEFYSGTTDEEAPASVLSGTTATEMFLYIYGAQAKVMTSEDTRPLIMFLTSRTNRRGAISLQADQVAVVSDTFAMNTNPLFVPTVNGVDIVLDNDARLSNARTPTAHTHAAADVTSGTLALARLPVAASGASSSTQVVRADDSRLSDARPPDPHTHAAADVTSGTLAIARLPVAASGASSSTQVVRADDSRLSLLAAYPVGAVYISYVSTSPATLFGGSWAAISDRVLIGVGSNVRWNSAGDAGGSETVTLTAAQSGIPAANVVRQQDGGGYYFNVPAADGDATHRASLVGPSNASAAHDNMPPFLAVYMWRRTA